MGLEIDSEGEAGRYIADVKRDIERMFSPSVIRQAHRQIELAATSPGLREVALLDRMIDLLVDRGASYDLIVVDTAPTGHTLQLLRMPDAVVTWIQALVKHRRAVLEIDRGPAQPQEAAEKDDPVLAALERRHERLAALRKMLDRSQAHVVRARDRAGAAGDRGNGARGRDARRGRRGRRRPHRQPRFCRTGSRAIFIGRGRRRSRPISRKSNGGSGACRACRSASFRGTCTARRRWRS